MTVVRRGLAVAYLAGTVVAAVERNLPLALGMVLFSATLLVFEYGRCRARPRLRGLYYCAVSGVAIWGAATIVMALVFGSPGLALGAVLFVLAALRGLHPRGAGWTWVALWLGVFFELGIDPGSWSGVWGAAHFFAMITVGRYAYHLDPLDFAGIPRIRRRAAALPRPK